MCLYPKLIKNRKYVANKKNGGVIPPVTDERVLWVAVGCGNCMECRKKKAREWSIRLKEDILWNKNAKLTTLTFSNESIKELIEKGEFKELKGYETDNEIATRAMRLFLERWRKEFKQSLRHWFITELGHNGTENIHMHGIVWTDKPLETVERIWTYGFIWKGKGEKKQNFVSEKTINYMMKYVHKIDEKHKEYKSIVLTSPGIGGEFRKSKKAIRNKFNGEKTQTDFVTETGHRIGLPIYYRNGIYSEEQREKLWLQVLDKNERWVDGIKIKADDTDMYNKLLKTAREKNARLGYGSDEKNWERKQYEEIQRRIIIRTRIEKAKKKQSKPAAGTAPAEGG